MRRQRTTVLVISVLGLLLGTAQAETLREAQWATVLLAQDLPEDLTSPEGRTRWDLTSVATGRPWVRTIRSLDDGTGGLEIVDRGLNEERSRLDLFRYAPHKKTGGPERWLLPHRDPFLLETAPATAVEIVERLDRSDAVLRIETARVGLGWLHLPSGPREVVLQRALVFRQTSNGSGFVLGSLVHRWIDPRAGVVAEIRGPVSADGRQRLGVTGAAVVDEVKQGQAGTKVYDFQMDLPVQTRLTYGYDRKGVCTVGQNLCDDDADCVAGGGDACIVSVSVLTPEGHTTIGDLIGAGAWDFSANDQALARNEIASTTSPINANETCSFDKCGFTIPGAKLGRSDKNFDDPPNADITTTVTEMELRVDPDTQLPTDVTQWLRAGVNKEGQTGSLGSGESRICYAEGGRTGVPLFRFPHQDGNGWYWALGDSWSSDSNPATPEADPFLCENTIFVHTCPNSCGLFCANYIKECTGYSGTQSGTVVAEGPVTLPSGHTFNALVVRTVAEFCVFISSNCGSPVFQVRTVVHLWEVPWLGTTVRLSSAQNVADSTSFSTVEETDIKHGPFPPLSITVGNVTDTSVELLWDPGLDMNRIDGFAVYWDTDSGSLSDYANRMVHPAIDGNSAVIQGLTAGTQYFFTITSMSDFTNPATLETTTYESLMFPMTTSGVPDPIPMEVTATTTGGSCTPTAEVTGLTVNRAVGGDIELCWDPATDLCLEGYRILGAASPESSTNFSPVVDTGLTTCQTITPAHSYYLVLTRGSGGTGPWAHFGL